MPEEGRITYNVRLPLSDSDTLVGLALFFRVKGNGYLLVALPTGDTLRLRPEGSVEVGFDADRWYVLSGERRRTFKGKSPSDVVSITLGASGPLSLVGGTLGVRLTYFGDEIRRVRVGDILDSPESYAGRKVLLVASPGGWGCPVKRRTRLPLDLSRSAITLYDPTGCIYGTGVIIAGRILSPDAHPIYGPGKEKVVVVGRVRLDREGTPYLSPEM